MGYYDSVKDEVRGNNEKQDEDEDDNKMNSNNNSGSGSFDTLKENAEKTAEEEDKGDDTPIEVLEEDGLKKEEPSQQQQQRETQSRTQSQNTGSSGNPLTSQESSSQGSSDMSGVEDKLDKIIEQNQKMIEILESFGQ